MFKIDKSTWEQMNSDDKAMVKQWIPEAHKVAPEQIREIEDEYEIDDDSSEYVQLSAEIKKQEIIANAKKEAAEIKEEAFREGYKKGLLSAEAKFEEITKELDEEFEAILRNVEETKRQLDCELEEKSLALAFEIAEKILNIKLENDDKLFVGIVKNTLAMMDKGEKFILKLSSKEYEKHYKNKCEAFKEELNCDVPITVINDVSLNAGGLILESENSFIDASVDRQLEKLADSLNHNDKSYHEAL